MMISEENERELLDLAAEGNVSAMKLKLDSLPVDALTLEQRFKTDVSWIYAACENNRLEMLQFLIDKGADVNIQNKRLWSPMHAATSKGNLETIKFLVAAGAKVDVANDTLRTPLFLASSRGNIDVFTFLHQSGASLHQSLKSGVSILDTAVMKGRLKIVQYLHANGVDLFQTNVNKETPLYLAAKSGHLQVVEFILSCKGKEKISSAKGAENALHVAAEGGYLRIVTLLVENNLFNINGRTTAGHSPLYKACTCGHLPVVKYLVENGADLNVIDTQKRSLLQVVGNHSSVAAFLIERRANPDVKDKEGRTVLENLFDTCNTDYSKEHQDFMLLLLKRDLPVDPNGQPQNNKKYWFAFFSIGEPERIQLLEMFLKHNPGISKYLANARDDSDRRLYDIVSKAAQTVLDKDVAFFGRFYLNGKVLHQSPTCIVYLAQDKSSSRDNTEVALKFMKKPDQFQNEVETILKLQSGQCRDFIVGMIEAIRSEDTSDFTGQTLAEDCASAGIPEYTNCLVMDCADRSLHDILQHELGDGNLEYKMQILMQVLAALEFLHGIGKIHGDVKSQNIVRVGFRFKLIDFDASVDIGGPAGGKITSLAFLPPEMLYKDESGVLLVSSVTSSRQVIAKPSYDLWCFGMLVYQMLTGATFFQADRDDNLTEPDEDLPRLYNWSLSKEKQKLDKILDPIARNFVTTLLNKDPALRPYSARHARDHAFLNGKTPGRLPGDDPQYDIFISYRVASDLGYAEKLYGLLTGLGLRVWWDKICLKDGERWEDGFCTGLVQSAMFIPIISAGSLSNFQHLTETSPCDNVLLEYALALELEKRQFVNKIFPVFIGNKAKGLPQLTRFDFSLMAQASAAAVSSVSEKLTFHLDEQGMGLSILGDVAAASTLTRFKEFNGSFVAGDEVESLKLSSERIQRVAEELKGALRAKKMSSIRTSDPELDLEYEQLREENDKLKAQLRVAEARNKAAAETCCRIC